MVTHEKPTQGASNGKSITYEVRLRVLKEIQNEYLQWLETHVAEMLRLPGMLEALCWRATSLAAVARDAEFQEFVVHYRMESREALDRYLKEFAQRMRSDGLLKFRDQFRAQRFRLEPLPLEEVVKE